MSNASIAFTHDEKSTRDVCPEGGESSITPLPSRSHLETGGEDTVHLSLGIDWGPVYDDLMQSFGAARANAEAQGAAHPVDFAGRAALVHPGGRGTGGGQGQYFAYRVDTSGFRFEFTRQAVPKGQTPNVMVYIGSKTLLAVGGLPAAWEDIQAVFGALGASLVFDKVSRADLCVDLAGVDVRDVVMPVMNGCAISRARHQDFYRHGLRWEGVKMGRGDVVFRAYDKLREVTSAHPDAEKMRLLEERRWGGLPECATRFEFQLRREALKQRGIDSVGDYMEKRGALAAYLCHQWLRLADSPVDRGNKNQSKAAMSDLWRRVCAAFESWAGTAGSIQRVLRTVAKGNVPALIRQACGCLMSAWAVTHSNDGTGEVPETREFYREAARWLLQHIEDSPERIADALGVKLVGSYVQVPAACRL